MYLFRNQIDSIKKGTPLLKVLHIFLILWNIVFIGSLTFVNSYINETERGKRRLIMRQINF